VLGCVTWELRAVVNALLRGETYSTDRKFACHVVVLRHASSNRGIEFAQHRACTLVAMEIDDLRYFVAAYEALGLTMSTPQPLRLDASKRVHRLEQLLRSPLFRDRGGRTVPTRAGDELYEHAKQMMGAMQSTGQTTIPAP